MEPKSIPDINQPSVKLLNLPNLQFSKFANSSKTTDRPPNQYPKLSSTLLKDQKSKKRFLGGEETIMEKALTKVGSIKVGSFWLTKKAKEEFNNISGDINSISSTVEEKAKWIFNKLKGTPMKSLPDLLREHNLPRGLFPQNVTSFELDDSKSKLTVYLPSPCEITFKDGTLIRYATRVKCILLRDKLIGIEGMKTKVLVWVKITNVSVEGYRSEKVWFTAGVKKSRPREAYDIPRDAIRVKEF